MSKFIRLRVISLLVATFFCLTVSSPLHAQSGADDCAITDDINSLSDVAQGQLRPLAARYFLDPTGNFSPDDIAGETFKFTPCQNSFDAPRSPGALWLKFTASNPHREERIWGVTFMETVMDDVRLFEARGSNLIQIAQDGRTVPAVQSDNDRLQTAVSFRIEPGQGKTYYVRVSGTYAPSVMPVIGSVSLLSRWSSVFSAISAALLGFCIIMTLFSLILFRHIEARFYQYYAAYLISMFFVTFLYDGWPHILFGSIISTDEWKPFIELSTALAMLANIQYCRILLTINTDVQQRRQGVFHWLTGLGVIATIWAIADPLGMGTPVALLFMPYLFVLLYVSARKALDGIKQAVLVLASLLALTMGLCTSIYVFLFPVSFVKTESVFELIIMRPITLSYASSTIVEGIFMLIAISVMINAMQRHRNAAVSEAIKLRDQISVFENQLEEARETTSSRNETLTALLSDNPDKNSRLPSEHSFLHRATQAVLDNVKERGFGVRELASALNVTEKTLGRRLKKSQGLAPVAFIRSIRLSYARDLILQRQYDTVVEIADASGFANASHFAKFFRQEFKETPSATLKSLPAVG